MKVKAEDLRPGFFVKEWRGRGSVMEPVELEVTEVKVGRFVNYWLETGELRTLSPYVEVTLA